MQVLHLLCLLPELRALFVSREIERVLPVARHGLHIAFRGLRPALRVDTRPGKGALTATRQGPARLRGGTSAWPDVAAVLDRAWAGRTLDALEAHPGIPAARLAVDGAGSLTLVILRGGGALVEHVDPTAPPRLLPPETRLAVERAGAPALDPASWSFGDLAEPLERWGRLAREHPEETGPDDLRALIPALEPQQAVALCQDAGSGAERLGRILRLLRGESAGVGTTAEGLPAPLLSGEASIGEATEAWYRAALDREELSQRAARLSGLIRGETRRVRRAIRAVEREVERSEDPARLRRLADALLAHGASTCPQRGRWRVPDPWDPERALEIPVDPPGASFHQAAERLYARARREERGAVARAARLDELRERSAALAGPAERLRTWRAGAADGEGLAALESEVESLGLAARPENRALPLGRGGRRESSDRPARVYRTPSGLTLLLGRSARQNDRLTFKMSAPEDLWLHVVDRSGSHAILRCEQRRDVPEEDLRFAAEMAAAWSSAPEGERVEVHVARRKHVRKPKGAPPGAVSVRKSRTLLVTVPPRPR